MIKARIIHFHWGRSASSLPRKRALAWLTNRWGGGWVVLWMGLAGTGCETAHFYTQALQGHAEIVFQQQPIRKIVSNSKPEDGLSNQLSLVLSLREFAGAHLGLPAEGNYLNYVDLGRDHVVWDVYAAPEFSLEPKTWWYPVVGSLSYRGYYKEAAARACAEALRAEGYDVFVGGVDAYSTLGWFSDPVLNTFIDLETSELADLMFHELAHQKVFVNGDTDFNEAYATAVAREGVKRWLKARNRPDLLEQWERKVRQDDAFVQLILKTRQRLQHLYETAEFHSDRDKEAGDSSGSASIAALRTQKERILLELKSHYEELKAQWGGRVRHDRWFDYPVNNARLNAEATYHEWVPAFQRLLAGLDGDLNRFYEVIRYLGDLPPEDRMQRLAGPHDGLWFLTQLQRGPGWRRYQPQSMVKASQRLAYLRRFCETAPGR